MTEITVNNSRRGPGARMGFSVMAAVAVSLAGFLLATLIFFTFGAAFAPGAGGIVLGLLVLWIPWVLLLFVGSAAAENSWRGAVKRIGLLVTATAGAFVAGLSLAASIAVALIVGWYVIARSGSPLFLLVIPLLLLLLAGAVAVCVWLARRSRIFKPWLAWFLIGIMAFGPAFLALFALTYHAND